MMHLKTQNLAMVAHVKNMEAMVHQNGKAPPVMGHGSSPESTPKEADYDEDLSNNMLLQIDLIDQQAEENNLEKSLKPGGKFNNLFESFQAPNKIA